jgi:hypothetical protein
MHLANETSADRPRVMPRLVSRLSSRGGRSREVRGPKALGRITEEKRSTFWSPLPKNSGCETILLSPGPPSDLKSCQRFRQVGSPKDKALFSGLCIAGPNEAQYVCRSLTGGQAERPAS